MQKPLLLLWLCLTVNNVFSQARHEGFESGVPANFTASVSGTLSVSNLHQKKGTQSLAWTATHNAVLSINNLQIPTSEIFAWAANSAQFWIYSNTPNNDTLVFRFIDNSNVVRRQAQIVLNYQGWRDFHRSYRYDYNFGAEQSGFPLNKITITYRRHQAAAGSNQIFFDEMTFTGDGETRVPGPHNGEDYQHFRLNTNYTKAILAYQHEADIPVTTATAEEIAAIQALKDVYQRNVGNANVTQINAAKNYVNNLNISTNADGSLKGRGIYDIYNLDTLLTLSNYVAYLSRAYVKNGDSDALAKLNAFVPYLLDQGLAEGGRVITPYNNYSASRNFPVGFLEALPLLSNPLHKDALVKMLKWSLEFNQIYDDNPTPGLELDYMYLKSNFLLELALLGSDNNLVARDLKSFLRYLEQYTYTSEGGREGLKADGTGFHHQSAYINYQYSYSSWIARAHELKGTPFKISPLAYENMKRGLKTLFLQTSQGVLIPHSASGRNPFTSSAPVKAEALRQFIEVGGDLAGQPYDTDMAQFYNDVFQTTHYPVAEKSWNGYHQFNYAQTGVYRKDNWVAVAKGLTDRMFGAEIYTAENRYGRYQGYGALEILYNGTLAGSGYLANGNGWDWNMMPGTTSVLLPYEDLKPLVSGTASEYQQDAYAGALANGKYGIFGLNFVQNPGTKYTGQDLRFKQSVFTFDSLMLCLGSGISAQNANAPVISTLFQNVKANNSDPIYINQVSQSGDTNQQIDLTNQSLTLVNTQGTGYYLPKGNNTVNVFRGNQSAPVHSSNNTSNTATAYASKVWLNHGLSTSNSKYSYVVVPATDATAMQAVAQQLENGGLFEIIKHTDSLHAVVSLADTVYAFNAFLPNNRINIGKVAAVDSRALFFVKESGKALEINISSPDLNAVEDDVSGWKSSVKAITLTLKGYWEVDSNPNSAAVLQADSTFKVTFNLKDGLAQSIRLKDNSADSLGRWISEVHKWNYNLGDLSGSAPFGNPPTYVQGSETVMASYSHSISSATVRGFLPKLVGANSRVMIVNNTGGTSNGSFILHPDSSLSMSASAVSGINKFSVFNIANATAVATAAFDITFSNGATNGEIIWALGNRANAGNLFNNASSVYRQTDELFTAFLWEYTSTNINFKYRQSASSSGGNYTLVSNSKFLKGRIYRLEVYANNSVYNQTYLKNGVSYTLASGAFNIWVKDLSGIKKSELLSVAGNPSFSRSNELPIGSGLNSYLFQGGKSTAPVNNALEITLANMVVNYANGSSETLNLEVPENIEQLKPVADGLKIYPNPFSDTINLVTEEPLAVDVYIYDAAGRLVYKLDKASFGAESVHSINLSALKPGVYYILIDKIIQTIVKQ